MHSTDQQLCCPVNIYNYIELVNTARVILLTMTQFPSLSEAELPVEVKQNAPENL